MSQITTHVLETSSGLPAEGVHIELQKPEGADWRTVAQGQTNSDGRISDLLDDQTFLTPGTYRMQFHTGEYYKKRSTACFYPFVQIVFEVFDQSHYHVPLLLSPFAYSTYRGS